MQDLLITAATVSGLVTIASDWRGVRRPTFYVAKPLTTLLILGLAWLSLAAWPAYRAWVMAALGFCLAGDVALMFHGTRAFVAGLSSFLVGHLLLIAAFATDLPLGPLRLPPTVLAAAGIFAVAVIGYAGWLLPLAGRLKVPVTLYVAALAAMVLVALLRAALGEGEGAWWVCGGALLFALSDSVLAYRKFVATPWWGQPMTLLTYYAAIGLIAGAH